MKKIEIVLPCYNEERVLERNFLEVLKFLENSSFNWQIKIVENGSTDNTLRIAEKLASKYPNTQVLMTAKGRGNAVKKAWLESNADFMLYMDIDLSTKPYEIPKLVKALEEADIVIGSRALKESSCRKSFFRNLISRIYNKIVQKIFKVRISDAQCGFKGINKQTKVILNKVKDNNWFFDTELLIRALKAKLKIKEVPISWNERNEKLRKSKVKILKDSFYFLINIYKLRRNL